MKNILFVAHDDSGQEARLQCALDVVRAVGGHLNCLDVAISPLPMTDFAGAVYSQSAVIDEAIVVEQRNREVLERRLQVEGMPYTWFEATAAMTDAILDHALLNDLVVVNTPDGKRSLNPLDVARQIVSRVGRPIMLVPPRQRSLDVFGTALVAWDGSPPAEVALRAAMPLLSLAERVVLLTIGDCDGLASCEDAAAYCRRSNARVEIETLPKGLDKTDEVLSSFASAHQVDWVLMGAYGHSQVRETVFGGMTEAMIAHTKLPLIIAR